MELLKYFTVILLGLVSMYHCVPVSSSSSGSSYNPEYNNPGLEGGDMVPFPGASDARGRGVAIRPAYQRWARGVIPYEFAGNISANNTAFIIEQMRVMENLTQVNNTKCIQFRPKNATDLYFITIFNGSGCYAPVGSWGASSQTRPVSLMHAPPYTCMVTGIIQHELTHVLGFFHEQSRPDRDAYVSIQWANIDPANAYNFDKYNDTDVDTQMTSYDYGSVMHYEWNAFALNASGPTIIPTQNSSAFIGQRFQLSPIDILEIQRYYNCVATPSTTVTTTTATTQTTTTLTTRTTSTTSTTSTTTRTTSSTSSTSTTTRTTSTSTTTSTTSRTTTTSQTTSTVTTQTTTSVTTQTTTSVTTQTTTSVTTQTTTTETTTTRTNSGVRHGFQLQLGIYIIWLISIIQFLNR